MKQRCHCWSIEDPLPFSGDPEAFLKRCLREFPFQSMVLGIIDTRILKPDCFLFLHEVDSRQLNRWCEGQYKQDPMLREAKRRTISLGKSTRTTPSTPLPPLPYTMVLMRAASFSNRLYWYLAAGRKSEKFNEIEQKTAALLLHSIQACFDTIVEPGMSRLLIGSDNRLIHADPGLTMQLLHHPNQYKELGQILIPVIEQRWPELTDQKSHDMALSITGNPTWIRFRRGPKLDPANPINWYVELRPLEQDDVPPVDLVADQRISRALAFLSDHYAQSPNLPRIAKYVNTSPFHFHRMFTKQVGLSPKHYALRMQLQIAKWLLRSSRMPIGQIAEKTGFASHGHFTATFHRIVGISPTAYRSPK